MLGNIIGTNQLGSLQNFTYIRLPAMTYTRENDTDIEFNAPLTDSDNNDIIIERGVCYVLSTSNRLPTIDDDKISVVGEFEPSGYFINGSFPTNTTYNFRSYIVSKHGIHYGDMITITTSPISNRYRIILIS